MKLKDAINTVLKEYTVGSKKLLTYDKLTDTVIETIQAEFMYETSYLNEDVLNREEYRLLCNLKDVLRGSLYTQSVSK